MTTEKTVVIYRKNFKIYIHIRQLLMWNKNCKLRKKPF